MVRQQTNSIQQGGNKKRSKTVFFIAGLIVLVTLGCCIGYYVYLQETVEQPQVEQQSLLPASSGTVADTPEPARVKNPIDFTALHETNPDIYAWINVPGTTIDYPICQDPNNESFYLDHGIEGNYSGPGAIYTEWVNNKVFTDPVTLVYGHAGYTDIMFDTLHYFNDAEFFAAHEYFTIYTPGHILTYRIVSSYTYDNRHIINTHDFAKEEVLMEYYDFVTDPTSMSKNVREGVVLTQNDRIVQLSTCMQNLLLTSNRYIVTGQLVEDQLTY